MKCSFANTASMTGRDSSVFAIENMEGLHENFKTYTFPWHSDSLCL